MSVFSDLTAAGPLFLMQAALAARLQAAFPPREFQHDVVPARLTQAGWARLLQRTPFVGLSWTGMKPGTASGRHLDAAANWTVFLASKNSAGPKLGLLGDRMGPGQLGLAQVAAFALQGYTIPGAGTVRVDDVANLYADSWGEEAGTLTGINISIGFKLQQLGGEAPAPGVSHDTSIDDYLRHAATWRFDGASTDAAADTINLRDAE